MPQIRYLLFIGTSQRRESAERVLENISEVDSATGSNISGAATSALSKQAETDAAVAAISAMFPTVDEVHIRDLLKK